MKHTPHVELAKLHDEFPILNDIEGSVSFCPNEGNSNPFRLTWNMDPSLYRHLIMLGVTERITQLLSAMARWREGDSLSGRIEFAYGRCVVRC